MGLKPDVIPKTCASTHEFQNFETIMCEYIHTTKNAKSNTLGSNVFCLLKHTVPRLLELPVETVFIIPHT